MIDSLMKVPEPVFHFYLSNVGEWRTGKDLRTMMKEMDKQRLTYAVWYVPCAETEPYEIRWYRPQVAGAFLLQLVEFKRK